MSTHIIHTPFQTGDLISDRASRRVSAHRRAAPDPAVVAAVPSGDPATTGQTTPSPAGGPRILRRWSVAELIAQAAAGPAVVA